MPAKPMERPIHSRARSCVPPVTAASTVTIQNGLVAISTAISPLGSHCDPSTTPPLPKPSMKKPSTARRGHVSSGGSARPRNDRTAASTRPAAP